MEVVRSFVTAEALTNCVQGLLKTGPPERSHYRGASDHQPHAQRITFESEEFLLVTYNALWPAAVPYLNGLPLPNGKLPGWFAGKSAQMGLEELPLCNSYHQSRREQTILSSILTLMKNSHRVVLCLQEVGAALRRALLAEMTLARMDEEQAGFHMYPAFDADFNGCVTLWTADLDGKMNGLIPEPTKPGQPLSLFGGKLDIHNVHLPFNTKVARQRICERVESTLSPDTTSLLIVGDYNIPTMPQSEFIAKEAVGTQDLIQFAEWMTSLTKREPRFAVHPRSFTNWAPRQNCENPEQNWDHMDNMMMLPANSAVTYAAAPSFWTVEYH